MIEATGDSTGIPEPPPDSDDRIVRTRSFTALRGAAFKAGAAAAEAATAAAAGAELAVVPVVGLGTWVAAG